MVLVAGRSKLNCNQPAAAKGHNQRWSFTLKGLASNSREPRTADRTAERNSQTTLKPHLLRSNTMIKRFFRDETGLELSEYAVAAALVAIAVVGAFTALGTNIGVKIQSLA